MFWFVSEMDHPIYIVCVLVFYSILAVLVRKCVRLFHSGCVDTFMLKSSSLSFKHVPCVHLHESTRISQICLVQGCLPYLHGPFEKKNKSFCEMPNYVINTRPHCPKLMKFTCYTHAQSCNIESCIATIDIQLPKID